MKFSACILIPILTFAGCTKKASDEPLQSNDADEYADTTLSMDEHIIHEETDRWDYRQLYGQYLHESNMKGFTAYLEILPAGNDLTFSLSLTQNSCTGQAEGSIGMAIHDEKEYGGFYDNADCRMEFIFNLQENTIRIQEVGACRLHEMGCSFNGVYYKKRN